MGEKLLRKYEETPLKRRYHERDYARFIIIRGYALGYLFGEGGMIYQLKFRQGSKGIRQWLINVQLYIPNDDIQIYPFCRLHLVIETYGYLTQIFPKY